MQEQNDQHTEQSTLFTSVESDKPTETGEQAAEPVPYQPGPSVSGWETTYGSIVPLLRYIHDAIRAPVSLPDHS